MRNEVLERHKQLALETKTEPSKFEHIEIIGYRRPPEEVRAEKEAQERAALAEQVDALRQYAGQARQEKAQAEFQAQSLWQEAHAEINRLGQIACHLKRQLLHVNSELLKETSTSFASEESRVAADEAREAAEARAAELEQQLAEAQQAQRAAEQRAQLAAEKRARESRPRTDQQVRGQKKPQACTTITDPNELNKEVILPERPKPITPQKAATTRPEAPKADARKPATGHGNGSRSRKRGRRR